MYTIKCDGQIIYDLRDPALYVGSPKVNLEVNTVGSGSFTIYQNHPYYDKLQKLKSVFEVSDEIGVIFRGRMTGNSCDMYNSKKVDLEGAMAYFNDTVIRPYAFPEDFLNNNEYVAAAENGNVIEFFLKWLINRHNEQVQEFQRFRLGRVTVSDPNNYLTRSDEGYSSTWETLKSKLFGSSLGGYLCIRYEPDGNYIDYLSKFELTNTQEIEFEKNLTSLKTDIDVTQTYSAILPIGAKTKVESTDDDGNTIETEYTVMISDIADGNVTDDIVKQGDLVYSRSAVEKYGFILAPVDETTWDDVTDPNNLLRKASDQLVTDAVLLTESIDASAVDLHFTDKEIASFRIYRNVIVRSAPHGYSGTYMLIRLAIDLAAPQNTRITVNSKRRTLLDINEQKEADAANRIESAEKDIKENQSQTTDVANQVKTIRQTEMVNTANQIVMTALQEYVKTGSFDEFQSTLKAQLEIWAEGITGRVTATEQNIENVNGDLQEKFNTITKYFTFDINGLTVGRVDNQNKIVIDNDDITIYAKGVRVQEFRADGTSLIPILKVTQMLNVFGLQITETETHINCDYIPGVL